eukprot:6565297-Pyramimonas_sp.AAC.2
MREFQADPPIMLRAAVLSSLMTRWPCLTLQAPLVSPLPLVSVRLLVRAPSLRLGLPRQRPPRCHLR